MTSYFSNNNNNNYNNNKNNNDDNNVSCNIVICHCCLILWSFVKNCCNLSSLNSNDI